jgi:hypothetical protein
MLFNHDFEDPLFSDAEVVEILWLGSIDPFAENQSAVHLIREAVHRVEQLNFIYGSVKAIDRGITPLSQTFWMVPPEEQSRRMRMRREPLFLAKTLAEAFYFFAHRIIDINRHLNREFGVKPPCPEPKGITRIRNILIVHPEKYPDPIVSTSMSWDDSDNQGPKLKTVRLDGEAQNPRDAGLYKNAVEFKSYLLCWVRQMKAAYPPSN